MQLPSSHIVERNRFNLYKAAPDLKDLPDEKYEITEPSCYLEPSCYKEEVPENMPINDNVEKNQTQTAVKVTRSGRAVKQPKY